MTNNGFVFIGKTCKFGSSVPTGFFVKLSDIKRGAYGASKFRTLANSKKYRSGSGYILNILFAPVILTVFTLP